MSAWVTLTDLGSRRTIEVPPGQTARREGLLFFGTVDIEIRCDAVVPSCPWPPPARSDLKFLRDGTCKCGFRGCDYWNADGFTAPIPGER